MLDKETIEKLQKQLPYLPGHQFDFKKVFPWPWLTDWLTPPIQSYKLNERKSHIFDYCNEVPVAKTEAPGIGITPA